MLFLKIKYNNSLFNHGISTKYSTFKSIVEIFLGIFATFFKGFAMSTFFNFIKQKYPNHHTVKGRLLISNLNSIVYVKVILKNR